MKSRKLPQPSEEEAEVVADCLENGIGGVAGTAFEMAAAEVTIGLHVTITASMADRSLSSRLVTLPSAHTP